MLEAIPVDSLEISTKIKVSQASPVILPFPRLHSWVTSFLDASLERMRSRKGGCRESAFTATDEADEASKRRLERAGSLAGRSCNIGPTFGGEHHLSRCFRSLPALTICVHHVYMGVVSRLRDRRLGRSSEWLALHCFIWGYSVAHDANVDPTPFRGVYGSYTGEGTCDK